MFLGLEGGPCRRANDCHLNEQQYYIYVPGGIAGMEDEVKASGMAARPAKVERRKDEGQDGGGDAQPDD